MKNVWLLLSLSLVLTLSACGGDDDDDVMDTTPMMDASENDADPVVDATPDSTQTECPTPDANACDYFEAGACGANMKCTAGQTGPVCATSGATVAFTACAMDSQCIEGTLCANYGAAKACLPFCSTGLCGTTITACPGENQSCFVVVQDNQGAAIGELCAETCSLLGQDCAVGGLSCYTASTSAAEKGICATTGVKTDGMGCTFSNECIEGSTCVSYNSGPLQCHKLCDRTGGGGPTCPEMPEVEVDQVCTELTGHTTTGFCRTP